MGRHPAIRCYLTQQRLLGQPEREQGHDRALVWSEKPGTIWIEPLRVHVLRYQRGKFSAPAGVHCLVPKGSSGGSRRSKALSRWCVLSMRLATGENGEKSMQRPELFFSFQRKYYFYTSRKYTDIYLSYTRTKFHEHICSYVMYTKKKNTWIIMGFLLCCIWARHLSFFVARK